jgi:hypothetical protein
LYVRVRHEVACLAVGRAPTRSHLPCCGQYPTKACATRKGGVRSPGDHGATSGRMATERCIAAVTASPTVVRSEDGVAGSTDVHRRSTSSISASARCGRRLDQKGGGQVLGLRTHQPQTVPHRRRGETYPRRAHRRNVGNLLVSPSGVTTASVPAMPPQGQDDGKSEGHAVIGWRGVATSPHAQASSLPSGLAARERLAHRARRASQ